MEVSIIIPTFNSADTIDKALQSVVEQTFHNWEAIVVNDGSTDDTITIVQQFARQDSRIRLLNQSRQGACAARNAGIASAQYDWLLFLDADDWIFNRHLERLSAAADATIDAVYGQWEWVTAAGERVDGERLELSGDLFPIFSHHCPFPPFACLVRKRCVEAAGGWDPSFQACQDWDFWQRVSRVGTRFGVVQESIGCYRMRVGSISRSPSQLLRDGLRVIDQAYKPDVRVSKSAPEYREGLPPIDLSYRRLIWACWTAGIFLAQNNDANLVLQPVKEDRWPGLEPEIVADCLLSAVSYQLCDAPTVWVDVWPALENKIDLFLQAFAAQAGAPALAQQARERLESEILEYVPEQRPLTIGHTHAISVEVTRPLADIPLPAGTRRLHCTCLLEGDPLGSITLEASGDTISAAAMAEAIAETYAWPILGRYFEYYLYPKLKVKRQKDGLSIWRGSLCLAAGLPDFANYEAVHDKIGWELFLQEIWSRPWWSQSVIYNSQATQELMPTCKYLGQNLVVEVSQPLLNLVTDEEKIVVTILVGSAVLGEMEMAVNNGRITTHELRAAITTFAGLDLCRLAVREGLLGHDLSQLPALQTQLSRLAQQQPVKGSFFNSTIWSRLARTLEWVRQKIHSL
jgi:hypothetical protein